LPEGPRGSSGRTVPNVGAPIVGIDPNRLLVEAVIGRA
jgi:hypothetical protein